MSKKHQFSTFTIHSWWTFYLVCNLFTYYFIHLYKRLIVSYRYSISRNYASPSWSAFISDSNWWKLETVQSIVLRIVFRQKFNYFITFSNEFGSMVLLENLQQQCFSNHRLPTISSQQAADPGPRNYHRLGLINTINYWLTTITEPNYTFQVTDRLRHCDTRDDDR